MQFTDDELLALNGFLNGEENLPVAIEAFNVKLREHFQQDTSVESLEVEAAIADETVEESEDVIAPAPVDDQTDTVVEPVSDQSEEVSA